jgi:dTDP-4-dehydrorhamnose 3,5-epimerase
MDNEFATVRPSEIIDGVYFVQPKAVEDERGRFSEVFRREWIDGAREMLQVNRSISKAGVLRGMHYHLFQSDFWFLPAGHAFVALYDHRGSSKTAEKTETFEIKDGDDTGIYIPPGVAHGFYAITDLNLVYMVDQYFDGTDELGIFYDEPAMEITWPTDVEPILSDRDKTLPMLLDIAEENLPF